MSPFLEFNFPTGRIRTVGGVVEPMLAWQRDHLLVGGAAAEMDLEP